MSSTNYKWNYFNILPEEAMVQSEVSTISAVRQGTNIPLPNIHAFEARDDHGITAPFILMDCLKGNVAMNLSMDIPSQYKEAFFRAEAKIQVQLSKLQFPKIGKVIGVAEDGTYIQGPIPGLGGPFDTATEFFQAWSRNIEFDIASSISFFKESIGELASRLSVRDAGPFPLYHGDFGHNNIIVNDHYRVLGVIDWEFAFASPWEIMADFPLHLSALHRAIDAPWNYDENGDPIDLESIQRLADQRAYVAAVEEEEKNQAINSSGGLTLSGSITEFWKATTCDCNEAVPRWKAWILCKTDWGMPVAVVDWDLFVLKLRMTIRAKTIQ
ncbi:hypothetical protein MBLNU459_g5525t1 [Dothideomycetes sp. NU459]